MTARRPVIVACADCGRDRRHHCRGLCSSCWKRNRREGTLERFPARQVRNRADVVEDWVFLAGQGYTRAEAATRMGMTRAALDKAIERHSADDRAHEETAA